MALQGTIDTFELTEVVRLLAAGGKTGVLRLEGSRGTGRLWVDGGKVTTIEVDQAPLADGHAEAMFELLRFDEGSFTFVPDETADDPGEPTELDEILADAEAKLAEWREIERVVPTTRATVTLRPELGRADVVLDKARWRLVAAIGGGITVATLGEAVGLGELPVSRAVKDLIELGVLDLDDSPTEEPEPAPVFEPELVVDEVEEPAPAEAVEDLAEEPVAEVPPVVLEGEPVAATETEPGSARAQLDEFAAGFGMSEPAPFEGSVLDAPPLDVSAPVEESPVLSDFGIDGVDGGGTGGEDPLGDFSFDFEAPASGAPAEPAAFGEPAPLLGAPNDAAEVARQLSNLSPAAARAVAAAAKAKTDEEREAALAAVEQEGEEPIDRELLLRFLASVKS